MIQPIRLRLTLAALALIAVAALGLATRLGWTQGFDAAVMAAVRGAGGPSLTRLVVMLTTIGSAPVLLALLGAVALALMAAGAAGQAARLLAIVLGGRLAVELLKELVARARPPLTTQAVAVHSWSFPSAHAANTTITLLAIAFVLARTHARWRPLWLALAAAMALAIGASRVWLGVHWSVDVLAGWLFGLGWLGLCAAIGPGRR